MAANLFFTGGKVPDAQSRDGSSGLLLSPSQQAINARGAPQGSNRLIASMAQFFICVYTAKDAEVLSGIGHGIRRSYVAMIFSLDWEYLGVTNMRRFCESQLPVNSYRAPVQRYYSNEFTVLMDPKIHVGRAATALRLRSQPGVGQTGRRPGVCARALPSPRLKPLLAVETSIESAMTPLKALRRMPTHEPDFPVLKRR